MYFVEFDKVLKFAAFPLRLNLIDFMNCASQRTSYGYLSAIRNPNIKFDVITQCLPTSATLVLLEEMLLDCYYHMYKHVTGLQYKQLIYFIVLNPLDVFVHVAVTGIIKIVTIEKRT
ncbi:hypothetical protein GQX74_009331 [Glossina fuscipes]|nr:hypothetical protein GQX74_009331 [Glossina fuscipes]